MKNIIALVLRTKPISRKNDYISAIRQMALEIRSTGAKAIILSPFYFASSRSNKFAREYSIAVHKALINCEGVCFINLHEELRKHRKSEVLLKDGFHLSTRGHEIVGLMLATVLENNILGLII